MFDPCPHPRVFALPPGVDFPQALVQGLRQRTAGQPPHVLAQAQVVVNTHRMERRIRALFDAGPATLLPRVSLVTDLTALGAVTHLPPAMPPLRRRLELVQLITRLLDQQPDLAARASIFDLSDSLAALIDEMQGEGVSPATIRALDVSDQSGHWARAQQFIAIAERYLHSDTQALDVQARQRCVVEALIAEWAQRPPEHPVILAGSTGSRGTTMLLMEAVARLPQGAVVLPGYDFDQPGRVWDGLEDALTAEDHPQFRFARLMARLNLTPDQIAPWSDDIAPCPARNRLVSLALRPAPVTDAWMSEGPQLEGIDTATREITLIEAASPRDEALAIALRLRQAAEDGQSAALITPDRMLTRQVSAALDRWNILPDDSAGLPLHLSPPGRFLRHVAALFSARLDGEALLSLLKHPLCHTGGGRNEHLLHTRDLELDLRRYGPPFPGAGDLASFATRREVPEGWTSWVARCFCDQHVTGALPLTDWVDRLRQLAEALSAGAEGGTGSLWEQKAGQEALAIVTALADEAPHGGEMDARDFADLLGGLLSTGEVRDRDAPYPGIMIWGTLEARVMGAELLILGGLNEGSWPESPAPDPWLNRRMRHDAGLLLPERRIGLSAHDFQQAIGAPEVWLTRAKRSDDAETVPSRWLNRLTNLLQGLPDQGGAVALSEMRARGRRWLSMAEALEEAPRSAPAPRPSPRPPLAARPRQLSVTEIKKLIRDPYAIYARHVLRLKPLDPLVQAPDALLRGIVIHEILESFVRDSVLDMALLNRDTFLKRAATMLEELVAWPTARALWLARLDRVADAFLLSEEARRTDAGPVAFEARMRKQLDGLDFTLTGRADRIDRTARGSLCLYDYKTGAPPSEKQQAKFDRQLLIEAALAEEGGFEGIDPAPVARAVFIGMGGSYKEVPAPLDAEPPARVWAELHQLIGAYFEPDQGFTARRMLHKDSDAGDYDHLARFGEWDRSATPEPEDLT